VRIFCTITTSEKPDIDVIILFPEKYEILIFHILKKTILPIRLQDEVKIEILNTPVGQICDFYYF